MDFPDKPNKLVLMNGCYDLLHTGHMNTLNKARSLGDGLWIGINSDRAIRKLKGNSRPIISEVKRKYALESLSCVDFVFIFDSTDFSTYLDEIKPQLYIKGGDYTFESLTEAEKKFIIRHNITFGAIDNDPELYTTTTEIINKIRES